jgi:sulfite reductase alpha subunit-like flavoprotein
MYAQHRMLGQSGRLPGWREEGAALHQIIQAEGDLLECETEDYVMTLKKEGRYERDVY